MIKKFHYIKEDNSGDIEKYFLSTHTSLYPDFEFMAWKPGSSPLRILYDNGGLFVSPKLFSLKRVPDSCFEKPFLTFNNTLSTDYVNLNICYSDEKNPLFLSFMEKGLGSVLSVEGYNGSLDVKVKGESVELDKINLYGRNEFYGFDKLAKELYPGSYFMDSNIEFVPESEYNLHYLIINKDTESNKVHALCENFFNHDYKDEKHFLLFVCNDLERDLASRIGELLNYRNVYDNKKAEIIIAGNGIEEGEVNRILIEYIGRKFEKLKSCERLL